MANEPEARTVVLRRMYGRETDSRAGAGRTSVSAIIQKALLSYLDPTGGAQAAEAEEGSVSQSVADRQAQSSGCGRMKAATLKSSRGLLTRIKYCFYMATD